MAEESAPEKTLPMLVCRDCGKYFSQKTGEHKSDFIVEKKEERDNSSCGPCLISRGEESHWASNA